MDTDRLLKELAKRDVVSRSVLKKLEQKLADKSDVPAPRAVAKFLVDKGHLTAAQAKRALKAILTPEESAILESQRLDVDDDDPSGSDELPSLSGMNMGAYGGEADGGLTGGVLSESTDDNAGGKDKSKKKKSKKKGKKSKRQNEWDSPLILIGGGGLVLMLLIGGAILYLLGYESAEERFKNAQEAYDQGSYPQAIADFEEYLEKHPNGDDAPKARVRLGTARIRLVTDVKRDFEDAVAVAKEETDIIEDQEAYKDAQAELAALLPEIAEQLAERADKATEVSEMEKYVGLTEQALVLCQNGKLIPGNLRDKGQLNAVREVLERIKLRQRALESLESTLEVMAKASDSGDPKEAYAAHTAFIKEHPQLSQDQRVIDAVAAAATAEESLVSFVDEPRPGLTSEPESPVIAELAVAAPRVEANAPASGVEVLRLAGGLYGVSAKDGQLRWRRYVGNSAASSPPLRVGDDLIAVDARRKELVRLQAADGKLVWRAPLDDELAPPALVNGRLLTPGVSGRLYVTDVESGATAGYVQFAQPLRTTPAASADGGAIFLTGEHSSLYSLSAADLNCLGVFYMGHAKGSIAAPPVALQGRVLVLENDGAETSTMHVLGTSGQGAVDRSLKTQRIDGLVTAPPTVFARRVAVASDTGHVDVFEVSADDDAQPIVLLASRQPTRVRRGPRFAAVHDGELWLAEVGLFRYSISPSGNRLPVRDVEEPFRRDTFIYPLLVRDGVLIHARKRPGRPGVAIGATDLNSGKSYWETDLAAPPAGAPVSQAGGQGVLHATATGRVFRVGQTPGRFAVDNAAARTDSDAIVFELAGAQPDGAAVYWDATDGRAAYSGQADAPAFTLPGELACEPAPMGPGWIVPLAIGQVHYISGQDGHALASPYQPVLKPGEQKQWRVPGVGGRRVVLANADSILTLELQQDNPPRLEEIARTEATGSDTVRGRLAVVGETAFAARADGRVTALAVGTLEAEGVFDAGVPIVWGPFAVSDEAAVIGTADRRLVCLRRDAPGEPAWSVEAPTAELVGAPLLRSGALVIATRTGSLLSLALATGEPSGSLDVGQRLAAGPAVFGADVALVTPDGALVIVPQP
ncbi:outer membrane biogenesis protein BamB [Posidoniimonas polymericola]|uniref:Outer membrane biogenesis protein BamB n=1 Tax=Posidoniimonas polymericola TaxID=2528002 RepID=A0A5C5YLS7_9BACT|nr:PQQ-binding-like beta-propeller repeat protein [Posidoniimonas polymericola]TWT75862.1 outer membrane biogenesis protein BamB [Posidoniimonas polymericola]